MINNYLLTAFRNLKKNRLFSLINILGLAVGMTAALLILSYVRFERSYEDLQPNRDRIYRLRYERTSADGTAVRFASSCPPAGLRVRTKFPEVEKAARLFRYQGSLAYGEKSFLETGLFFAEPELFDVFTIRMIQGDPRAGLRGAHSALVSKSAARKYFGDDNPLGRTLSLDKKTDYRVEGVFDDPPANTHLKFDVLLSWSGLYDLYGKDFDDSWGDSGAFTYLLLKPGIDPESLKPKLAALVEAEFGKVLRSYNLTCELPLQPLSEIHLSSHYQQELEVNGDGPTLRILFLIAGFIIVIAWVNYINLSTARALTRAKEVGLRKVVGASRRQIMVQLFLETIVLNLAAVGFALLLALVFWLPFRTLSGLPAAASPWGQSWFWGVVAVLFFGGVFLSGLYPVVVLSSFEPKSVLRGKLGHAPRGLTLRKALVVFQFVMALGLMTATLTVFRQLSFMRNRDLGISIENVVAVRAPRVRGPSFGSDLGSFRDELLRHPEIEKFCVATEVPGRQILWDAGGLRPVGTNENKNYQIVGIDYDFADVFRTAFVAGRNFSKAFPSDAKGLILNETAVRWMGFPSPAAAIGREIDYWGEIYSVVGVMKDYHQRSPKFAFEPNLYRLMPEGRDVRGYFAVKIDGRNAKASLDLIAARYKTAFPGNPFESLFVAGYFDGQYEAERRFGGVFGVASFLSLFINGLGILGLTSFMIAQRTKELSIRKVLGAGVPGILNLFARDFFRLILISFVIALPLSVFGLSRWLESFALRARLAPELFAVPLAAALLTAGGVIGALVLRTALSNPSQSLRCE